MKNLKWIWIVIAGVVAGLALVLVKMGAVAPKSLPLIKPTQFHQAGDIGKNTYRRLRQEIGQQKILIFGIATENLRHSQALEGFLAEAASEDRPFVEVWCEKGVLPDEQSTKLKCLSFEMNDPTNAGTSKLLKQLDISPAFESDGRVTGGTILLIVPQLYSTHLLPINPIKSWEESIGQKLMSITLAGMAVRFEQMGKLDPICLGSERDQHGVMDLGCTMRRYSQNMIRKPWPAGTLVYQLLLEGEKDYLGLISVD